MLWLLFQHSVFFFGLFAEEMVYLGPFVQLGSINVSFNLLSLCIVPSIPKVIEELPVFTEFTDVTPTSDVHSAHLLLVQVSYY